MRVPAVLIGCLVVMLCRGGARLCAQPAPARPPTVAVPKSSWHWTTGASAGGLFAPGEIGRGRNATGGQEELIARLGDGIAFGAQAGIETRWAGFELRAVQGTRPVKVENEFGVRFPNHGKRPLAWAGSLLVYPLAPVQERRRHLLRPFVNAGLGGVLISVDLDNVNDQTLYHSFQWELGGGVRISTGRDDVPSETDTFVELRLARYRLWPNRPLRSFGVMAATIGLGIRF